MTTAASTLPTIDEHQQDANESTSLQPSTAAGDETATTKKSDSGIYFAMMLSEYLEKKAAGIETKQPRDECNPEDLSSELDAIKAQEAVANLSNVIWVPAHKHPQIAPSEFVNWIQTHGSNSPTRKDSKIKRQKSKLSKSVSYNDPPSDNEKDNSTTTTSSEDSPVSPKELDLSFDTKDTSFEDFMKNGFDRPAALEDDSRVLAAPNQNRTLLRRSALSARRASGADGENKRRIRRNTEPRHATNTSDRIGDVPTEGVSLQDRPVSLSEWIDLGSAGFEPNDSQQGILSRVHDAETQFITHFIEEGDKDRPSTPEAPSEEELNKSTEEEQHHHATTQEPALTNDKRPSTQRASMTDTAIETKLERKSSWISKLLKGDKKRKNRRASLRRVDDEHSNKEKDFLRLSRVESFSGTPSKKRGLAAFFSRSLSMKSSSSRRASKNLGTGIPDQSKSKGEDMKLASKQFINSYRLSIHVERAIYRMSHMKLANPRRPLHQQVVISNLMFWYLSIINPQQSPQSQHHDAQNTPPKPQEQLDTGEATASFRPHHRQQRRQRMLGRPVQDEDDDVPLSYYRR